MNTYRILLTALLALALGSAGLAQGQPEPLPPPLPNDKAKGEAGLDPTRPGPIFEKILNQKNAKNTNAPRLPNILLKGRIVPKGKAPVALVEVEGKLFMVSQDSLLSLGNNVTLKIVELSAAELRIEISPFNETIIVR